MATEKSVALALNSGGNTGKVRNGPGITGANGGTGKNWESALHTVCLPAGLVQPDFNMVLVVVPGLSTGVLLFPCGRPPPPPPPHHTEKFCNTRGEPHQGNLFRPPLL